MKIFSTLTFLLIIGTISVFGQTKRTEVANPSAFRQLEVTQRIEDCRGTSVTRCGESVLMALDLLGLGGEDNFTERKEVFNFNNGVHVFLFSVLATKPSFTDEWRVRIAFTKTRTGFKFVQAGIQHRCQTEQTRGNWQKNECGISNQPYNLNTKTLQSEVENLDDFQFITVTGRGVQTLAKPCLGSLEVCGNQMFNSLYKPDGFEQIPTRNIKRETFSIVKGRTTTGIFLITLTGYEDDSVAGERIRIEFQKRGNSWIAQSGSKQFLCYRGNLANRWTKEFCP